MAGEDTQTEDEIVVAIEPELPLDEAGKTAAADRGADGKFVAKKEAADPADDLRSQFNDLKTESERNRARADDNARRAADAERDAARAREEATTARGEVIESQASTIESGISAAQAEADAAEGEYKSAFEAGDAGRMAKAHRTMSRAEANLVRLGEAKADLEIRKTRGPQAEQRREAQPQPQTRQPDDPVEAFIAAQPRGPEAQKWLREHREFVTDERKFLKLGAAHQDALAEGMKIESPEYFEHIEKFVGIKANGAGNGATPRTAAKRPASVPVAPVHQSGGAANGSNGVQVSLTQGEAKSANDGTIVWNYDDTSPQKRFKKGDPIGNQEMARRKLALTKQGAYDRSYTDQ